MEQNLQQINKSIYRMSSKVNLRVKRKNEFSDKNIEPSMKALKKEDIIARYTALQAKYSILEQENCFGEGEDNPYRSYSSFGRDS